MKIIDLVEAKEKIDELSGVGVANNVAKGVGSVAGGVGAVAGGLKGAWDRAKQGYQSGKAAVSGQQTTAGAQATGAQSAPGNVQTGSAPDIQSQIKAKEQELAQLKAQASQQAQAAPVAQSAAPAPVAEPTASNQTTPSTTTDEPINPSTGKPLTDQERQAHMAAGGTFDGETGAPLPIEKKAATAPVTQQAPAASPAANTPPATTAPAGKLTAQQQAAKKAELLGKRAAGKTTASQTGSGFSQYVQGGGGSTLAGADAQGNPVFKQNVKREDFEFESKFLGRMI
jgi:hypothetical protein